MQAFRHPGLTAKTRLPVSPIPQLFIVATTSATGFNIGNYALTVNPPRYVLFLSDNPRLYLVNSPDSAVRMHDLEIGHCAVHIPTAKGFLYFLTVGISRDYHKVTIHIIALFVCYMI